MIIEARDLMVMVVRILVAAGASQANADCVAEHLVRANLCGVDTHGVAHLPNYVAAIKKRELIPDTAPEVIAESPVSALITGHWTFGHVVAKYGMEMALDKASEQSMSIVSLVQIHHIGRVGEYAEMAIAKGMIGMIWGSGYSETHPRTAPYGGRGRVLSTNPVAMGFPAGREGRMMFDFATTAGSGVKVADAQEKGEPLPLGWIVDKHGNPSTNAVDFYEGGAFLPFGGHKGYALMVGAELLGRVISGSDSYAEAGRGGMYMSHQGVTMIVFKADLFQPYQDYARRADELLQRIRTSPPAPGFAEVLAPGDPEVRTRATREREGIPLPDKVWQALIELPGASGETDSKKSAS